MIGSLLALAGSALAFGPSPLAEASHQPAWEVVALDDAGEGWIDTAWRSTTTFEGRPPQLVLLRMDITEGDGLALDSVLAVDCERQQIGVKEAWFFKSPFGNQTRAPITTMTLDFHDTPLSLGDLAVIAHACTGAGGAK
jgi:hypothetical protein